MTCAVWGRCTRTTTKKTQARDEATNNDENMRQTKNSDVFIQSPIVTTIAISDNKDENSNQTRITQSKIRPQNREPSKHPVVIRRTCTKTTEEKRSQLNSSEYFSVQLENKNSKSNSNEEEENSLLSNYEDAVSVIENNQDNPRSTYTVPLQNSQPNAVPLCLDSTAIVEIPKILITKGTGQSRQPSINFETVPKPSKKESKSVSNQFEKTPNRDKEELFEKLAVDSSVVISKGAKPKKIPQRIKKDAKLVDENRKNLTEKEKPASSNLSKFFPKACSTLKNHKLRPALPSPSMNKEGGVLSAKSASALKASQAEFREREKRRQEKEREEQHKREALLQAQTEEKRKRWEERQQRAQQQGDILEKEAQKQLELQRIRKEKFKQTMAERERKVQKRNEEATMKCMQTQLLKEKEEKKVEEKNYSELKPMLENQGAVAKKASKEEAGTDPQQHPEPLYMTTEPPVLPTMDCYDSDDSKCNKSHEWVMPEWSIQSNLEEIQLAMIIAGESIKNSFFCRQAQTPDLQRIFERINPRKLKRTSSANWKKLPRYTLLVPKIDVEESE